MKINKIDFKCRVYLGGDIPGNDTKNHITIYDAEISMTIKLIRKMWIGMTKTEKESWKKVIDEDMPNESEKKYQEQGILVLEQLKRVTGNSYRGFFKTGQPTANMKAIISRLKDGYTLQQLLAVIDNQAKKPHFYRNKFHFMRPITIFKPSLFDGYVQEVRE